MSDLVDKLLLYDVNSISRENAWQIRRPSTAADSGHSGRADLESRDYEPRLHSVIQTVYAFEQLMPTVDEIDAEHTQIQVS